ncbi:MAG: bifunctional phosphopantothenoylcysteine decarboxylase/phosphopantothenate--cysteine ligase CoaBC [Candidatus Zixiibacteriota bacterium]|nr:MAG: bifunctional phosphopantothenoylcysteine decarboxylase/phosphopantothenate--cysteine ligase CoaBC [candidate division Zixibacteria bacterium]
MLLQGRKVLVGLTGGIACYKVPYLIRDLIREGAEVRVVMTAAATKFITPLTMETVSANPVAIEMFPGDRFVGTQHIDLAKWPDLVVVAPATANFLGKVASGICDDLLTTIICATPSPVIVAPAMNPQMWKHPSTQRNAAYLGEIGYQFVGPAEGEMACNESGLGRMVEPSELLEVIKVHFGANRKKKALTDRRILITAGPCREPIDPVRYISNRSSGKMGFALASAAIAMGAKVALVSGPTSLTPPQGVEYIPVETTEQMYKAVSKRFPRLHCLIMAAAPADFTPQAVADSKIKKGKAGLKLDLKPAVDILRTLAERKKGQLLVGFALETDNLVANARKKLKEKNLDLIVLNSPLDDNSAFDSPSNKVTLIRSDRKPEAWPLMAKEDVARKLLEKVAGML